MLGLYAVFLHISYFIVLSSLVNVATPEEQKSILLLLPPKLLMSVNVLLPQLVNVAFLFDTKRYVQCCLYSERLILPVLQYFDTVPPHGYSIEDLRSRKHILLLSA